VYERRDQNIGLSLAETVIRLEKYGPKLQAGSRPKTLRDIMKFSPIDVKTVVASLILLTASGIWMLVLRYKP
jgi:hypothetical protein